MNRHVTSGDAFGIREVTLERIRIAFEQRCESRLVDQRLRWVEDEMSRTLALRLNGYLLGNTLPSTIIRTPKSWWDHLKLSLTHWTVAWIPRNWPVEYNCYDIRFTVLYPDFHPALPDERHIVKMYVSDPLRCPTGY